MTLPTLESVAKELAIWRTTRTKRGPIPDELRVNIGMLPARYQCSQIMDALNLNSAQIKMFSQAKTVPNNNLPIEFVRITRPSTPATNGIICQITRPDGSELKCTVPTSDFQSMIQVFLCSH